MNGATVRAMRELLKIRGSALANSSGISHPYLVNIEKGIRQPAPDKAENLARALGVPLEAITYPECPTCAQAAA